MGLEQTYIQVYEPATEAIEPENFHNFATMDIHRSYIHVHISCIYIAHRTPSTPPPGSAPHERDLPRSRCVANE